MPSTSWLLSLAVSLTCCLVSCTATCNESCDEQAATVAQIWNPQLVLSFKQSCYRACQSLLPRTEATTPRTTLPTLPQYRPTTPPIINQRCGLTPATDRVVGGTPSWNCEFPWMVALTISTWFCGGTILDQWHILSAAHCFKRHSGESVTAGEVHVRYGNASLSHATGTTVARLDCDSRHLSYVNDFDTCVITLAKPLNMGRCVAPICLPENIPDITEYDSCYVAGWGTLKYDSRVLSPTLMKVEVPKVDSNLCAPVYAVKVINDLKFCAGDYFNGGIDACKGDSGGPYMCQRGGVWYQFGIVSFGIRCAEPQRPGVYTRLKHPSIMQFVKSILLN